PPPAPALAAGWPSTTAAGAVTLRPAVRPRSHLPPSSGAESHTMDQTQPTDRLSVAAWLTAAARALHPARWAVCLAGLVVSQVLGTLALALFEGDAVGLSLWWQDPTDALQRLGSALFEHGSGRAAFRCGVLAALLAVVWGLAGGWVIRDEL